MPTTVTKSIRASGGDYTTIQAWEDACPADLVGADQIWKGELYKEGGGTNNEWVITTGLAFGGSTVDATRYLWLTAASGVSFYDHASKLSNALRYNSANGVAVGTGTAYQHLMNLTSTALRLTGLQLAQASGTNRNAINSDGSSLLVLERCIVVSADPEYVVGGGQLEAYNSVVYSLSNNSAANGVVTFNGAVVSHIINCTIHGAGNGSTAAIFSPYNTQSIVKNTAAFGFGAFVNNATNFNAASSNNNATNLATGLGSSNQTSLTTSAQVEATGAGSEDFRAKATGALAGNGVRAQTYTADLDIVGTARSTSIPYIGAWENALAAPTAPTAGSATEVANTTATANWTDNSTGETGFPVETSPSPYSSWTSQGTASANATSLSLTGLSQNTTYKFRVAATNGAQSAWSESPEFTTTGGAKGRALLLGVG